MAASQLSTSVVSTDCLGERVNGISTSAASDEFNAEIQYVADICIVTYLMIWNLNQRAVLLPPKLGSLQFAGNNYKAVKEVAYSLLKTGFCIGVLLTLILRASFRSLAKLPCLPKMQKSWPLCELGYSLSVPVNL
ncbi:hypothetical protein ACET3Z_013692 [Daucus carota]